MRAQDLVATTSSWVGWLIICDEFLAHESCSGSHINGTMF